MQNQIQPVHTIAVFPNLDAIGKAVDQLVLSGFPLAQIYLVGKDIRFIRRAADSSRPDNSRVINSPVKELLHAANLDMVTGAKIHQKRDVTIGQLTGGMTGLLVGLSLLVVLGIGEMVLGSLLLYLLSITGGGTMAGGALGALVSQNLTTRRLNRYMTEVFHGKYLLIVHGSEAEVFWAEQVLAARGTQPQQWI
ncbi:MAG: hypothetical protein NW220_17100 [Leptolyngbyaceae cyanobacterium bins.349]|nr:hypothetical protein [Leptolyngbyaceae cyanobacterium bins.349]